MPANSEYVALYRDRYEAARSAWETVRKDFKDDIMFVSGNPSDQWDPVVKNNRDDDGVPALTMDRLNPLVNQIVNQARKDRPQPKVNAGDGGDPATAEAIEGKVRHLLYESHADVAFDTAEMYCASGGFGYVRITKECIGKYRPQGGYRQTDFVYEPRVKRVPDPLAIIFDPNVQEDDYSDAEYAFVAKKYTRKEFKAEFHKEPIPFPFEDDVDGHWGDDDSVMAAEYWWVEKIRHRLIQLADGRIDISTEIGEFEETDIVNEMELIERIVHCDIVDGSGPIEQCVWEGKYIPIIPVVASEMYSGGVRRYKSAVRYSRDPQSFINASFSSTAEKMATQNMAPFTGYAGQFKDPKWRDGKRHFYLETPTRIPGFEGIPPLPQRMAFEPAIQASTSATLQGVDALKGAVGYVDSVTQPSQANLSGVAVDRRDNQKALANAQYEDSLVQSMWHTGRVIVDLLLALSDTPREWDVRAEDGTVKKVPITVNVPEGVDPNAPGYAGQPHLKVDDGDYGVTIYVGPSYNSLNDEEADFLTNLITANPNLTPIYLPAIFKRRGYHDLEEIATAAMPPDIQKALAAAKGEGLPPALAQQQAAQLEAENQKLKTVIQQVLLKLQTKQVETEGKLQVQDAKTRGDLEKMRMELIGDLMKVQGEQQHDATKLLTSHHMEAIKHVSSLIHAHDLAKNAHAMAPPIPEGKENE